MLTVGDFKEMVKGIQDDVEIRIGTVYYRHIPILHNCECPEVVFDTDEEGNDIIVMSPYETDFEELEDENEQNEMEEE